MARVTKHRKSVGRPVERQFNVGRLAPLTGHLRAQWSPIREFLLDHVSSTLPAAVRGQLTGVEPLKGPGMEFWEHALVGTALDYRIRYSFGLTPAEHLVAGKAASTLLGAMSLKGHLADEVTETPGLHLLIPGVESQALATLQGAVREFMAGLDGAVHGLNPVKLRLDGASEELLARYCLVLANLDAVYRAAVIPRPFIEPRLCATSADLLATARPTWLRDLRALTAKFLDTADAHGVLELPAVLNPTFAGSADMAADADLIVDACVVEVKCAVDPSRRLVQTLAQLLGYVLLDYEDRYKIDSAGVYFARQGRLLRWSLAELTGGAVTQERLGAVRLEFREILRRPARIVGGHVVLKTVR